MSGFPPGKFMPHSSKSTKSHQCPSFTSSQKIKYVQREYLRYLSACSPVSRADELCGSFVSVPNPFEIDKVDQPIKCEVVDETTVNLKSGAVNATESAIAPVVSSPNELESVTTPIDPILTDPEPVFPINKRKREKLPFTIKSKKSKLDALD